MENKPGSRWRHTRIAKQQSCRYPAPSKIRRCRLWQPLQSQSRGNHQRRIPTAPRPEPYIMQGVVSRRASGQSVGGRHPGACHRCADLGWTRPAGQICIPRALLYPVAFPWHGQFQRAKQAFFRCNPGLTQAHQFPK